MNVSLRRAAYALLGAFLVLAVSVTYVQAINAPEYRDDPRNPRVVAWRTGRERGPIVTSDRVVVAESRPSPNDPTLFQRAYPFDGLYAHTVGYTSVLFGSRGLERTHASELTSNRDSTISGVLNGILGGDTRPRGLRLTIDHRLQQVATDALGQQRGAVIALDPKTGAVLALVSYPSFDPNSLIGLDAAQAGADLENDPDQPLRNRVSDETYAPGSVFKIVTTAAGLDTGLVSPSSEFPDPVELELPGSSSTIKNFDGEVCRAGTQVSLEYAFVHSCNTTFAQLGMKLGGEELARHANQFGFNKLVPFDLETLVSFFPDDGSLNDNLPATAQSAIGQLDVQTTPLLVALSGAAVANGGEMMVPYLVYDIFTSDGTVESSTVPMVWRRAMSPATASVLSGLMEQAVVSGTGKKAAVPGVRIAGKTGTAQVTGKAPHAWFVGFGPVEPEPDEQSIVVAVVVESGGDFGESATGGSVAAPIAQKVLATFFE
ncbi:MAG: penicillin-binding transpeptidase domain-containing protein [Acidimicrobiia bacterium]|nr:penicillin-binding transpeptidase domain-containing protein [Acidimicrobiia bacterium]